VLDRTPRDVLLEVGGVGYRLAVPTSTLAVLELGAPAFVHVHTHVREDAIILYGFSGRDERDCFEALIGTHGVGPAVALAILSVHSPAQLRRAIASDDVDALTLVPGIGKKTAARLLIELKARLDLDLGEPALSAVGSGIGTTVRAEVRAALAGLGYGADEVREVLASVTDDGSVEEGIRVALKQLVRARSAPEATGSAR
jgi:Holliday junction DNA helicase RuvA